MDKDSIPVLALVVVVFVIGFFFFSSGLSKARKAEIPGQAAATDGQEPTIALNLGQSGTGEQTGAGKSGTAADQNQAGAANAQIAGSGGTMGSMRNKTNRTPNFEIDTSKSYTAVLTTTEGVIRIQLNDDQTPKTVGNFVNLAKDGFYNDTIFHRTINGFMIQGGDPLGNGTGGPGYKFEDEKFEGAYERGVVAMANSGPNTNGSQFFIMHKDYGLPPLYTIFGKVTEGMDVVDKIATAPTKRSPNGENSTPINPVKITSVQIIEE